MSRKELKSRAKNALKSGSYWTGYGVNIAYNFINSVTATLISLFFSFGIIGSFWNLLANIISDPYSIANSPDTAISLIILIVNEMKKVVLVSLIMSIFTFLLKILFTNVLTTGQVLWFSRNREQSDPAKFSLIFNGLRRGRYSGIVKGMFWRDLWLFVWQLPILLVSAVMTILSFTLLDRGLAVVINNITSYNLESYLLTELGSLLMVLLIISIISIIFSIVFGVVYIVKLYSYRAVEWILADNPNIGHRRAVNLSKVMTKGFKGKWFILDLSFIGWILLLILTLPFMFFTAPLLETYIKASYAEFYAMIRDIAVNKGYVTMEELGYIPVQDDSYNEPLSATDFYQNQGLDKN